MAFTAFVAVFKCSDKYFTIIKNVDFKKLDDYILNYDKGKIYFINNVTTLTITIFIPKSELKKSKQNT